MIRRNPVSRSFFCQYESTVVPLRSRASETFLAVDFVKTIQRFRLRLPIACQIVVLEMWFSAQRSSWIQPASQSLFRRRLVPILPELRADLTWLLQFGGGGHSGK